MEKVKRVVDRNDPVEMGFLSILFSCGGKCPPEYLCFEDFKRVHGYLNFENAKKRLLKEALIKEAEGEIRVNYQPLDEKDWKETITECNNLLFREGQKFFTEVIRKILLTPEGRYALTELCKGNASEDTVNHIRRTIGLDYWYEIELQLASAGLFGTLFYSKRHVYYFISEPLVKTFLLRDPSLVQQLCWIYIAQNIRERGSFRGSMQN